jgi:hypothetical protein
MINWLQFQARQGNLTVAGNMGAVKCLKTSNLAGWSKLRETLLRQQAKSINTSPHLSALGKMIHHGGKKANTSPVADFNLSFNSSHSLFHI